MYTLLIADDERLECDAIELLVNRAKLPLRCIKAKNGREAVGLASRHHPDIAFLDIRMPGMDGLEAAARIREDSPDCQIVFLTAWSSFEFAQKAIRLGASEYLVKPAQSKEVYALLDSLIARLDEEKNAKAQHSGEIREVLNLFSREFFTALKFGELPEESVRSYFTMQGISVEQGMALVIGGLDEQAVKRFFADNPRLPKPQLCYFPAVDRTTVLLFTTQPAKTVEELERAASDSGANIGSGMFFSDLHGIPESIGTASIAYTQAYRTHASFQRFRDALRIPKDEALLRDLSAEMLHHTLEGNTGKARERAHEIVDILKGSDDARQARDEFYDLLVVYWYEVHKSVPLLTQAKPGKESLMELEVYLMDLIDAVCQAVTEDRKDRYGRTFRFVEQYLHAHYGQQLSIEETAKMVGLSPKYFGKLCKIYLGSSFVEYLTAIRMEKAKELLDEGTWNVKEVAQMTGYPDGNYFTRVFRQYCKVPPSVYRDENR
jgi:two-component system response regulator YesN